MKKTLITASLAALVIAGLAIAPKAVEAYKGDPSVKGPNYTPERHEAMTKAFETNDYNAWKTQMNGRGRVSQVITAENFGQFAKAHQLMLEGKADEAQAIRTELGLGLKNGSGRGQGMGCARSSQ
jgi:hypothetical protein